MRALQGASATASYELEDAVVDFVGVRPQLYGIAYGVLRDAGEAEDVAQDVWIRWQNADRAVVECPPAFLSTATRRLALNVAASARRRRETPTGELLPEPADGDTGPEENAAYAEQVGIAVRVLLEKTSFTECATFVLREGFGYPYEQIAAILHLRAPAARQLMSRARKHLASERSASVDDRVHRQVSEAFLTAARTGNVDTLERVLGTDHARPNDQSGKDRHDRGADDLHAVRRRDRCRD